jgi:hypothetical protein
MERIETVTLARVRENLHRQCIMLREKPALYTTTARMWGKKYLLQVFLLGHAGLLCD